MASTTQALEPQGLETISRRPDFRGLTPAQQEFVRVYLTTGGNAKVAILSAFPNTSDKHIRTRISHIMAQPTIRRILEIANGVTEMDSILAEVGSAIRQSMRHDLKNGGSLSVATKDLVKFFVEQLGQRVNPAEEDGAPKFAIGELFRQNGRMFQVTAVEIEEMK
jgi:hypothetical protein